MAYNTVLEAKLDDLTARWKGADKRKMFGGVCYLLNGNMALGVWKDSLIVRMDKELAAKSLKTRHVRPFDITGRTMAGWIMVDKAGWKNAAGFEKWAGIGRKFARSLPEKTKAKAKKTKTLRKYRGAVNWMS